MSEIRPNQDVDIGSKEDDEEVLEIEVKWLRRNTYAVSIILGVYMTLKFKKWEDQKLVSYIKYETAHSPSFCIPKSGVPFLFLEIAFTLPSHPP